MNKNHPLAYRADPNYQVKRALASQLFCRWMSEPSEMITINLLNAAEILDAAKLMVGVNPLVIPLSAAAEFTKMLDRTESVWLGYFSEVHSCS